MTLKEEILRCIDEIPENNLPLLLNYAQFLEKAPLNVDNHENKKRDKPRLFGAIKGEVWMSDDFNDPLEFVSSEEMKVLEALREAKMAELQEVAV